MALYKIKDFDPDYRDLFDHQNILDYDLYSGKEKIGSIDDLLVDEEGRFRYLVIHTGLWIFGKRVLLPIGQARISHEDRRIYALGLSRQQVENLPEYKSEMTVDPAHEAQVLDVYRSNQTATMAVTPGAAELPVDTSAPLYASAPLEAAVPLEATAIESQSRPIAEAPIQHDMPHPVEPIVSEPDRELYSYDETNHPNLRLYEERLIANKLRRKAGEVTVSKYVETETTRVAVPVERERIVIERTSLGAGVAGAEAVTGEAFREGEVARIELFEETPDIHKEAFVREEVRVRKTVEHEVVETETTLRKEELDLSTEGNPQIERPLS